MARSKFAESSGSCDEPVLEWDLLFMVAWKVVTVGSAKFPDEGAPWGDLRPGDGMLSFADLADGFETGSSNLE